MQRGLPPSIEQEVNRLRRLAVDYVYVTVRILQRRQSALGWWKRTYLLGPS